MNIFTQIKSFWQQQGQKVLSGSAFVLVVITSFLGGTLFQKDHLDTGAKLVINIPDYDAKREALKQEQTTSLPEEAGTLGEPIAQSVAQPSAMLSANPAIDKNCPYVGSKNSTKYHLASCGVVKRIKPENRRCFASPQVAEASGYVAGCTK